MGFFLDVEISSLQSFFLEGLCLRDDTTSNPSNCCSS
jgi:hypothetical protein